jgi:ribosomal protein S3
VFSSLFQSAPAVAHYVAAALEAGTSWQRVERFFLASVEAERDLLAGIKVQVKGRIGG